jgi:hypothetical protein
MAAMVVSGGTTAELGGENMRCVGSGSIKRRRASMGPIWVCRGLGNVVGWKGCVEAVTPRAARVGHGRFGRGTPAPKGTGRHSQVLG